LEQLLFLDDPGRLTGDQSTAIGQPESHPPSDSLARCRAIHTRKEILYRQSRYNSYLSYGRPLQSIITPLTFRPMKFLVDLADKETVHAALDAERPCAILSA